MDVFQKLEQELSKLPPTANERSLYTSLNNFLTEYANNLYKVDTYSSVAEESGYSEEKHIGFPDLTLRNKEHAAGWVEVKNPGEPLDGSRHLAQFTRYKNSFENLIITNMQEWQLWQWDSDGNSTQVKSVKWDPFHQLAHGTKEISELLKRFLEGTANEVRTPKQLAIALARKTQILRDQVVESYRKAADDSQLVKLKQTFENTLIQNITDHQFANMVAETIAYSLFLARLEYEDKHKGKDFSIDIVRSFLPKNVPVLKDLYEIILRVSQDITPIDQAIGLLVDQLNVADIDRIRHKLIDHKPGEDPVIQFYEPFLNAYDPKERESRGVYYTPKPLVDYIVRSVDYILKSDFDKKLGLADETVQILDPAIGSGTFLMSAVQQVHYNLKLEYGGLGEEELERRFQQNILHHVLKHFYGFELLMAPYAVSHLKLTLELERMGFDWANTVGDGDEDNNRLKIYLANSLDDPDQPPKLDLPGFHLAEESNKAMEMKKNPSVIAIIGNPPYSGASMNPHQQTYLENGHKKTKDTFIGKLIKDYKQEPTGGKLQEQTSKWLQDDYVKFIRFCQDLIVKHGFGVIGLVTNHGYIDNPTFRGMRYHLLQTFDEIFILDLHGNSLKNEVTPDGEKDENVFSIRQGAAIIFLIKKAGGKRNDLADVYHSDLWGKKRFKESWLANNSLTTTNYLSIKPSSPSYVFKPKDNVLEDEYNRNIPLSELFKISGAGITTAHDSLVISEDKSILLEKARKVGQFIGTNLELCSVLGIREKLGWDIDKARKDLSQDNDLEMYIKPVNYRPFENHYIFYNDTLVWRPVKKIMHHFGSGDNIGLVLCRQQKTPGFRHILAHTKMVESCYVSNKTSEIGYSFPLYLYGDTTQTTLYDSPTRTPNLNIKLITHIEDSIKLKFIPDHSMKESGDITKFSPLDIYDYIYAILHSPNYREKYKDFLKNDFPRVPFPINIQIFWSLVNIGGQLRNLHLMGDDPFSKMPPILKNSEMWGIQPKGTRDGTLDWKIEKVEYNTADKRAYINDRQYFEGIEPEVWNFNIGGYQIMDKWLKDRKKAGKQLSADDRLHYVKIAVVLRETIRIQKEIDETDFMEIKNNTIKGDS